MTRHRLEVLGAFVAGVLLTLAVVVPAQAGLGNCRPAWKCAPSTPGATASRTSSPTTAPTVAPTPTRTPTSAPTVSPTSGAGRPFPAPVTSRTLAVPASITGAAVLNTWLASVPDGSVIDFGPSYAMPTGLAVVGKSNLVLRGHGTTLTLSGPGDVADSSAFFLRGSAHISIEGSWTVVGNNPDTTNIFVPGKENSHVLALSGWYGRGPSSFVEISGVTASHVYGDFAYLEGRNVAPYEPSHDIWIHGNTASYLGRNAISLIDTTDVVEGANTFDRIGMDVIDVEPNFGGQQVRRVTSSGDVIGSYGHMRQYVGWLANSWAVDAASVVEDISVTGHVVAGNPAGGYPGSGPRALAVQFTDHADARGIAITGLRTSLAAAGPVMRFTSVDGVTVTGNVQPLTSGALASFSSCTGVVYP